MLKSERQNQIYSILQESGSVTVKELSERLFISESSIRRDLAALENEGFLKRSYGGAQIINSAETVMPFGIRTYRNVEAKKAIAQKAVRLINNGDIVFLDQTSTSYFLAVEILKSKSVTVVTNNREILNLLSESDITVVCTGGVISKANNNCLLGQNAQRVFEGIYADIAFISAKALSGDGVVSDFSQEEVFVRKSMLNSADKKVLLCDCSKLNTHSAYKQCTLNDVDYLITESNVTKAYGSSFPKLTII
ncbi:MAG: DeoR/GlpR transcriptional regulator [Ruminococcaceae bacterium]|nr:DeoR/GlpR transcriptional regulator [Oscillospiraceae bacterium]